MLRGLEALWITASATLTAHMLSCTFFAHEPRLTWLQRFVRTVQMTEWMGSTTRTAIWDNGNARREHAATIWWRVRRQVLFFFLYSSFVRHFTLVGTRSSPPQVTRLTVWLLLLE